MAARAVIEFLDKNRILPAMEPTPIAAPTQVVSSMDHKIEQVTKYKTTSHRILAANTPLAVRPMR